MKQENLIISIILSSFLMISPSDSANITCVKRPLKGTHGNMSRLEHLALIISLGKRRISKRIWKYVDQSTRHPYHEP